MKKQEKMRVSVKKVNMKTHMYWKTLSVTERMEMAKVVDAAFMALYKHLQTGGLSVLELHREMMKSELLIGATRIGSPEGQP
jgi:hypothetical protein